MRVTDSSIANSHKSSAVSAWVWSEAVTLTLGLMMIAAICFFTAASVVHGAVGGDPMTTVKNTVNQALDILKDRETPPEVRRRGLIEIVAGHFEFTDMARSSLGYHWSRLSPAQQQQFVQLFTAFMEDAYLNKLEGYSGQKIEFSGVTSNGPGDSEVNTRVLQPDGGQPISLSYRLRQDTGDWKVYDVTVDNISITANYRNQFNRVINSQGFDALMNEMRTKQQELIASLGK